MVSCSLGLDRRMDVDLDRRMDIDLDLVDLGRMLVGSDLDFGEQEEMRRLMQGREVR